MQLLGMFVTGFQLPALCIHLNRSGAAQLMQGMTGCLAQDGGYRTLLLGPLREVEDVGWLPSD